MKTEPFEFVDDGNVLRGVIDLPAGRAPRAELLKSPPMRMSDGYYETILAWLRTEVLDDDAEDRSAPRSPARP
jgi:hypothetical protein